MRKFFAALLVSALLLPALASCKTVSDSDETSSFEGTDTTADTAPLSLFEEVDELRPLEMITLDHVYRGEFVEFPEDVTVVPAHAYTANGKVYVKTTDKTYASAAAGNNSRAYRMGFLILSQDDTVEYTLIPPSTPLADKMNAVSVFYAAQTGDGFVVHDYNLYRTEIGQPKATFKTTKPVLAYVENAGTTRWKLDPEALVQQRINPVTNSDGGFELDIRSLHVSAAGTVYMLTNYSVVAVSPDGVKLNETGEGRVMEEAVTTADGRVLVRYTQFPEKETRFAYMDEETKDFGEPFTLPLPQEDATVLFGEGYDVYYHNPKGLFGINRGDAEPTLLCNWENSCIDYKTVQTIQVLDADTFFCIVQDPKSEKMSYAMMHRVPEGEALKKKVITLGMVNGNYDMRPYAARFNRQNSEYHVIIRDYLMRKQEGGNTLEEDALAGTLPDIVMGVTLTKQMTDLTEKGTFVDLNRPLSVDTELRDDLLPFVLEPFETAGALYWLNSVFMLDGMIGNAALLPEPEEWTLETFLRMQKEYATGDIALVPPMYREKATRYLLYNNLSGFIRYDEGTCNFENELFLSVIEYLKTLLPNKEFSRVYNSRELTAEKQERFHNGTMLVETAPLFNQFRDWQQFGLQFGAKEIVFLGNPSPDGGRIGINAQFPYAITVDSPVKEGAWEFIRYMFFKDSFAHGENMNQYFPVSRSGMRKVAEKEMAQYCVMGLEGTLCMTYYWDGKHPPVEIDAKTRTEMLLTEDVVEKVFDLLENRPVYTNANAGDDEIIKAIIDEELSVYYAGSITAEMAAQRIQSRVSIYLAEQS